MASFDPRPYLRKLQGKDYLEVVHRLQWLRAEHPEAVIATSLLHLDWDKGVAVFHARVEVPGQGAAEGTGSETREAFPAGWLEKAETVAIGRALAALGYGTAFCLDFETVGEANGKPADAPVERRAAAVQPRGEPATSAQLRMIYALAKGHGLTDEAVEQRCRERYGRAPRDLTKIEASEFIDGLK